MDNVADNLKKLIQPQVSVIVPVYRAEGFLKRCMDSLINQTFKDLEMILVDDGSPDESGKMCDEYALSDSRILSVHKKNGGLVSAWKRGVRESHGKYLCFVDVDDWVDFEMIQEMFHFTSGSEKEIVSCDYVIEKEDKSEPVYQTLKPGTYNRQEIVSEVFPLLLGNEYRSVCLSRCMKLISRKLIEENLIYSDEAIKMGEDVTVILPALLDCERLTVLDKKAYYHYYYNECSMVHLYDKDLYHNLLHLRKIIETVIEDKNMAQLKPCADREFVFFLMLAVKNEARGGRKGFAKRILSLCSEKENRDLIRKLPVMVRGKSGKLIYLVMTHPNYFTVFSLRAAMLLFYSL